MAENDDAKRLDRAEERILNLQNGEATQNERLDDLDEHLEQIDELLEGKPTDRNDNGLKGDIRELGVNVNALQRVMLPDSLGHGGVINRLKALEHHAGIEQKKVEFHWQAWIATIGLISGVIVAIIYNLDHIEAFWIRHTKLSPLESKIERAKHPKGKKIYRVRVIPASAVDNVEDGQKDHSDNQDQKNGSRSVPSGE